MARDRKFTDQDIVDAVNTLMESGKPINGSSLRSQIGVGRPDTLMSTYLSLVEDGAISSSHQYPVVSSQVTMPDEMVQMKKQIIDSIENMFSSMNSSAHELAESKYIDWVRGAQERAEESELKMIEAQTEMEKAFNEVEDISDLNEQLTVQNSELIVQLEATKTLLTQATEINTGLLDSQAKAEKTIADLDEHVLDLNDRLDRSRQSYAVASSNAEERLKLLQESNTKNDLLNVQITKHATDNAKVTSQLSLVSIQSVEKDEKIEEMTVQLKLAQDQLVSLNEELQTSSSTAKVVEQRNRDLGETIEKMESHIKTLTASEKKALGKASDSEGQAKILKANIKELNKEHQLKINSYVTTIEALKNAASQNNE